MTFQLRKADAHELLRSALEIVRSDIEQRHLTPFVALEGFMGTSWSPMRPACSKFSGACCTTRANSLPKMARFLCGLYCKPQEESPS